jgi:simple sugar transport system ATP-binding protein
VAPGEIHGLLGQNGAGKSTLMKVLLGLMTPDSGHIRLHGEPVVISDPIDAAKHGMAMVHQHFSLVEALTVWENVALGDVGRLDPKATIQLVRDVGARYGLDVDPEARVRDLTTGERQRVELVKCLRRDPSILILDEPTSVLTRAESQELFAVLRTVVKDESRAVVLISHKLDEILHATDEVTIMRSGRVVNRSRTEATTAESLATDMVGRSIDLGLDAVAALGFAAETVEELAEESSEEDHAADRTVLRVEDVHAVSEIGVPLLRGLSLTVRAGEILGLAGVEGNGQAALTAVLSDLLVPTSGSVQVGDEVVPAGKAGAMVRAGIGVIPEDRHRSGCILDLSVAENLAFLDLEEVSGRLFLDRREMRRRAEALVEEFEVALPSLDSPMRMLSGGNQQKVVLARELHRGPKVLVAEQPTHGLDVGAVQFMNTRLRAAAEQGIGVLLISTELEELIALSDRIVVIHGGRIMGEMPAHQVDVEKLGLMMGGRAA